jgi:hypothetical protein
VGDGLDAAAGEIEVGDRVRVENAEGVVALRRYVDVPVAAARRAADEEQALGADERGERLVDGLERLTHMNSFARPGSTA